MAVTCSCFQSRGTSPGCRDFSDTDEWQGDYVRQFPQDSARSHLRTSISRGRRGAAFLQSGSLPPDPAAVMKSPHSAPSVGPAPPQPPGNASRRPRSVPPPARGARGFSREGSAPRRRAPPGAIPPGPRSPGRDGVSRPAPRLSGRGFALSRGRSLPRQDHAETVRARLPGRAFLSLSVSAQGKKLHPVRGSAFVPGAQGMRAGRAGARQTFASPRGD